MGKQKSLEHKLIKKISITLLWLILWTTSPVSWANDEIELVTSDLSPYSIEVGLRPGFFVEIVSHIEDRLGTNRPIDFFPWPRAQMLAGTQGNRLIFPLTRTPQREDYFNWLIDVASLDYVFITLDGKEISLKEARKLDRITVQQSTPFESFLKAQGFTNIVSSPNASDTHIRLLTAGRVNAWFTAKDLADYALLENNILNATFSEPIETSRVYIATSQEFPAELAENYRRIFAELKSDGTVDHILRQYRRP